MMKNIYLAIGIGGMLGAASRYGISLLFPAGDGFPFATLLVNLLGCFLVSFLLSHPMIKQKLGPEMFAAVGIGFIGSFTTFSTFMVETVLLFNTSIILALGYLCISVLGGLFLCIAGYRLATRKRVSS